MAETFVPTWRYHAEKPPMLVRSAAELDALGEDWADTPAAFYETHDGDTVSTLRPEGAARCGHAHSSDVTRTCARDAGHRGAHAYRPAG